MSGCTKEPDEYNKPADYWYEKMINAVSNGNLEKADNYYSSLQSEHIGSPLLVDATLIMAQAHMAYEEYLLSEHFLDEYNRRYATREGREYAEFLKIKAKFLALPNPGRDQGLINETLKSVGIFKTTYPYSTYIPLVNTMETQLQLAKGTLNIQIAELYTRLGKPKGNKYYAKIAPVTWIDHENVVPAVIPWYREMFEGDGSSSWYAFMIPNTRHVVSIGDRLDPYAEDGFTVGPDGVKMETFTDTNGTWTDGVSNQILDTNGKPINTNDVPSDASGPSDQGSGSSKETHWYDFFVPSSKDEPIKQSAPAPVEPKEAPWYDFFIPSSKDEPVKPSDAPPKSEQKGSWYDFLIPSF
jgi:outer membrane protein assembly factor BamD